MTSATTVRDLPDDCSPSSQWTIDVQDLKRDSANGHAYVRLDAKLTPYDQAEAGSRIPIWRESGVHQVDPVYAPYKSLTWPTAPVENDDRWVIVVFRRDRAETESAPDKVESFPSLDSWDGTF
jgi:hypothetical protein